MKRLLTKKGFGLIESLVSIAIFLILAISVYQISAAIVKESSVYRENTTVSALTDQYLEIVRNLPYAQVGTLSGNPHGVLPDQPNAKSVVFNGVTYQIFYEVTYVDDPADGTALAGTDFASDDYKQVKLSITNTTTGAVKTFLTNITPKGLENLSNGGALYLKVFDAVGQPVPGATITITNTSVSPSINLTRTSDANGNWIEVGLPDSSNSYHVAVTKSGYSSDQTYPISGGNPSPTKPDATISNGQVTQISFGIDRLSSLTMNTYDETCAPLTSIPLELRGAKLIGTPSIYKFDTSYSSNGSGQIGISSLEWDNYTPAIGGSYMIYGSSPIQLVSVLPNTSQVFTLILGPKTTNSLLVIVKDATTGNPVEGATVDLQTVSPSGDATKLTAGSVWSQQDWTGGAGQSNFTDTTKYSDGTNVSTTDIPTAVRLINSGGNALFNSGTLTSSTYDTGTASSTYTTLLWQPTSQNPGATVRFQMAANNDNATWNYVGPDGTASTYYTTPGSAISDNLDYNRYVRYRAYLDTTDLSKNPVLTSVGMNYVSGCFAPGQTIFTGLAASPTDQSFPSNYNVIVSMPGYVTQTISNVYINNYAVLPVSLVEQ